MKGKIQSFLIFHSISIHFPPIFPTAGEASPRRSSRTRALFHEARGGWQSRSATSLRARVPPWPPHSFDPLWRTVRLTSIRPSGSANSSSFLPHPSALPPPPNRDNLVFGENERSLGGEGILWTEEMRTPLLFNPAFVSFYFTSKILWIRLENDRIDLEIRIEL